MTGLIARKYLTMAAFGAITLAPLALLLAGALSQGGAAWIWLGLGLAYMGGMVSLLDQLSAHFIGARAGIAPPDEEFPASDALLCLIALGAFGVMGVTVWAIARGDLSLAQKLVLGSAAGLWLGQVAHPCAHELIHRGSRGLYRLGVALYAAMLFGHHASAHRLVHHRHVGTPLDPYSAKAGLGFWRFAARAWRQGYRSGKAAEDALIARRAGTRARLHPYHAYALLSLAAGAASYVLGGFTGVIVWGLLSAHAQLQQLLADYVQHYGLRRDLLADGRYEPVGARHSWNNPQWLSSHLMLNAPRHSDHHSHPARPYPALRLEADAPQLPWPLPMACTLALWPSLWHRLMRPRLAALHNGKT